MFRKIRRFCIFLALTAVVLGAYSRLSGSVSLCAGWPGCDGAVNFDDGINNLTALTYRCVLGILAALVIVLGLFIWRESHRRLDTVVGTFGLVLVVAGWIAADFWLSSATANPVIESIGAMLGFLAVWLSYWLYLRAHSDIKRSDRPTSGLVGWSRLMVLIVGLQVFSGLWVSVNHAGTACSGFPQCNEQWWPQADYRAVLAPIADLVVGPPEKLAYEAQVAANALHRLGALIASLGLLVLVALALFANAGKTVRKAAWLLSLLLLLEVGLGIFGVRMQWPLALALAHGTTAALLLLPVIAIGFYRRYEVLRPTPPPAKITPVPVSEQAPPVAAAYVEAESETLYRRLKSQLRKTRSGLGGVLEALPFGQKAIDEDLLETIEANLLMADIGIEATTEIIGRLTERLERHQLSDAGALEVALKQELLSLLQPCSRPLQIPNQDRPFVILVVGVNGAGKTTTIGKMAKRLQAQGHSVILAAGDTFRAAAVEQLQTWGERNHIHVVAQHTGADSASVIYDGVQSAQAKGIDVLIADTAGRLHTKSNLMEELKKVKRIMGKLDATAPHEVLLVLDAGTGQNALSQAKLFNETVALTGIALTKLDGTAKGGVIFALARQLEVPIRYIGIGEGIDDLQDFNAESFVEALFVKD